MSTRYLLLALASMALPVRAQVTVTHAMFEAGLALDGTNTFYATASSAPLLALAAQTGENQTWDFVTGITYDPPEEIQISPVSPPVPGSDDPHLAQATHITRYVADDSTFYIFTTLSSTEAAALGLSAPSVLIRYVPQQRNAVVPFTFGSTWTASFETQFEPPIPGITFTSDESTEVVGWGTLVTPAGSAPALMVRIVSTSAINFPPLPPIVTTTTQVLFTAYGEMNASIHIPQSGPATGEYNVFQGGTANAPGPNESTLGIEVDGAHPVLVGQDLRLAYTLGAPAQALIEVFDAVGRRVWHFVDSERAAGVHRVAWGGPAPAPGVYLARVSAGGEFASRAFTVTR